MHRLEYLREENNSLFHAAAWWGLVWTQKLFCFNCLCVFWLWKAICLCKQLRPLEATGHLLLSLLLVLARAPAYHRFLLAGEVTWALLTPWARSCQRSGVHPPSTCWLSAQAETCWCRRDPRSRWDVRGSHQPSRGGCLVKGTRTCGPITVLPWMLSQQGRASHRQGHQQQPSHGSWWAGFAPDPLLGDPHLCWALFSHPTALKKTLFTQRIFLLCLPSLSSLPTLP